MSTFAPGVRPQYIAALTARAERNERRAAPAARQAATRCRAVAALLEMDYDGTIDLEHEPALRDLFVEVTHRIDVQAPRYWDHGDFADTPRPTTKRLGVVKVGRGVSVRVMSVILATEDEPRHAGSGFPAARTTGARYRPQPMGGVAYSDLADELADYSPHGEVPPTGLAFRAPGAYAGPIADPLAPKLSEVAAFRLIGRAVAVRPSDSED